MGTVNNDSCLEKIKAGRFHCAICNRHKVNHVYLEANEAHDYIDAGNEPIFVLRAQDVTMVETIQHWFKINPDLPPEKREEALALIDKVLLWPKKKTAD